MKVNFNTLRMMAVAFVLALAACLPAFARECRQLRTVVVRGTIEVAVMAEDSQLVKLNEKELSTIDKQWVLSRECHSSFPLLNTGEVEVIGHMSDRFNCIAWSMGICGWVNPETGSKDNPLSKMDKMYESLGYHRIAEMDVDVDAGFEKVAVYAMVKDGQIVNVTHACRQEPDGSWTSKLGSAPLIRHPDLDSLSGPGYGEPVAIYVRKGEIVPAELRQAEVELPSEVQVAEANEKEVPAPKHVAPARREVKVVESAKHVSPVRRSTKSNSIVADKDYVLAK